MLNDHLSYVTVMGPNLRTFLQGYITCDLDAIQPDTAMPMAITEIKGRVVANGWVIEKTDHFVLLVHASVVDIVQQHLLPYMRFARCELSIDSHPYYVTQNPAAESAKVSLKEQEYGFTDQKSLAYDIDVFQIETGYALVTEATSGKFLPQMLNLTDFDAVSFSKGCYLGQEVVARAEHRGAVKRRLFVASHDNGNLSLGDQVRTQTGDKAVIVAQNAESALVVASTSSDGNDMKLVSEQVT